MLLRRSISPILASIRIGDRLTSDQIGFSIGCLTQALIEFHTFSIGVHHQWSWTNTARDADARLVARTACQSRARMAAGVAAVTDNSSSLTCQLTSYENISMHRTVSLRAGVTHSMIVYCTVRFVCQHLCIFLPVDNRLSRSDTIGGAHALHRCMLGCIPPMGPRRSRSASFLCEPKVYSARRRTRSYVLDGQHCGLQSRVSCSLCAQFGCSDTYCLERFCVPRLQDFEHRLHFDHGDRVHEPKQGGGRHERDSSCAPHRFEPTRMFNGARCRSWAPLPCLLPQRPLHELQRDQAR